MANVTKATLSVSGDVGSDACASVFVCQADSIVAEALAAILTSLQAVEVHRNAITPMLDRQIGRLSCTETEAARLAAVILSQFAYSPR